MSVLVKKHPVGLSGLGPSEISRCKKFSVLCICVQTGSWPKNKP